MLSRSEKELLFNKHVFELQLWVSSTLPTLEAGATSQLLLALPSIPVKSEHTFADACHRWLRIRQCIGFYEAMYEELVEFLIDNLLLEDVNAGITAALADLTNNFHRFGGRTRGDFALWASRRLLRLPDIRKHASVRAYINLTIDDFEKADVPTEPSRLADFSYTIHGDEYHIKIGADENGPIIWRVLDLNWARNLWPVRAKKFPDGRYFVAKTVNGHTVPVHRLKFNVGLGDVVKAYDGDFLNFCYVKFVTTRQIFWGDWAGKARTKSPGKPLFKPAEGTKPGPVEFVSQEDVLNLYVAHDSWGRNKASVQRQNDYNWRVNRRQFLQVENAEGETETQEFGDWQGGFEPVSSAHVFRPVLSGINTPANLPVLDNEEDRKASREAFSDLASDESEQGALDSDRVRDGDKAGERRIDSVRRPTLADDPEIF